MPSNSDKPVPPDRDGQTQTNASNSKTSPQPSPAEDAAKIQERMFIQDLIASGKAAVAKDGKLPPGATHEIVGQDADGQPIVVRRRFSAF